MYNKIVENFRKRLGTGTNNTEPERSQQTRSPQPSTSREAERQSPQPSTSRSADQLSPQPSTSRLTETQQSPQPSTSGLSRQGQSENFIPFPIDSSNSLKVYENDHIEVFIEKTLHQRHKRFQLQDFLYNVKIKVKKA